MKKIRRLFARIRWLLAFPDRYDADLRRLEKYVGEHVELHTDIHMRSPNIVIAVGRYRHRDYVRIFEIDDQDLEHFIRMLQQAEKDARLGRVDAPHGYGLHIKAVYDRHEKD